MTTASTENEVTSTISTAAIMKEPSISTTQATEYTSSGPITTRLQSNILTSNTASSRMTRIAMSPQQKQLQRLFKLQRRLRCQKPKNQH